MFLTLLIFNTVSDHVQNCVIKIDSFVIIKKGEIVRTRFGSAILSLSFDDNKEYVGMNNFGTLMFVILRI